MTKYLFHRKVRRERSQSPGLVCPNGSELHLGGHELVGSTS
ncbi:Hypothetical protein MIP_01881 [Mycobacterium intracellulare subsp. intracellulare MTCC 9506]|uniref:Uncharacterized protein n=1 Tax=Mycobacterium indicus pranii (strain DSM 45239 / MTCC 9506) TaxID=1232724 RepID=J9WAW8_MYCIP|nr:hypothetical protein OCQ_11750 [Mycobacterium paraintracellulare]AFS13293.1 Hypothetical protein MIP_01881 [Mycobacterium intracellulare subsp. intracellulare MTCC 9506]